MIPVYEPFIGEEEAEAVAQAVRAGEISARSARTSPPSSRSSPTFVGSRHGVAMSSGTTALQLAVQALDLAPGDEVLVSASTNIATALAAFHNGAVAVPVDSERVTWNLDLDLVEDLSRRGRRRSSPSTSSAIRSTWTRSWRSPTGTGSP